MNEPKRAPLVDERELGAEGVVMRRLRPAGRHDWLSLRERGPEVLATHGRSALRRGLWAAAAVPTFLIATDVPGWSSHYGRYAGDGERNLRRVFARRARRARAAKTAAALAACRDGEVVCARGRVRRPPSGERPPISQLFAVLTVSGTYHAQHHHVVVEWGRDFDVELDDGGRARVFCADAWFIGSAPDLGLVEDVDTHSLWRLPGASELLPNEIEVSTLEAGRCELDAGARVAVLATKTRTVDAHVAERLPRQEPWLPALRAGAASPLVILAEPRAELHRRGGSGSRKR